MTGCQVFFGCVIFSTHQMNDAEKLCDRAVIIHKGKVIANDAVEMLKNKVGARDLEDAFMKIVRI